MEAVTLRKEYLEDLNAKVKRGEITKAEAKAEVVGLLTSVLGA